jgi:hypothetical protein
MPMTFAEPHTAALESECDCPCHAAGTPCTFGCNDVDADVRIGWAGSTCVGGTLYQLYDTRED